MCNTVILVLVGIPGWAKLWPFQQNAAVALANGRAKGLWCATGTGKTAMILAAWALIGLPIPILFITKAIGRHVFGRDAQWVLGPDFEPGILWAGQQQSFGVHNTFGRRTYTSVSMALSERLGVVTNYEVLQQRFDELVQVPWRVLVFDEVHEIKGGHRKPAKRRDGTLHLLRYHWCRKLADLVRARGGVVWSATATPVIDRRRDLYAQVDVLYPGILGTAWHFLHRWCDARMNIYGGLDTIGRSNTEELMHRLNQMFYVIRRADVADQMPPLTRDVRIIDYDSELYQHMGGGVETALNRAAEAVQPAVLDLVAEYLAGSLKVVVVTTRRRLAYKYSFDITSKKFARRLPRAIRETYSSECVTGEIEAKKRVRIVERFNGLEVGPAVLTATMYSLMTSIDLHQTDGIIIAAFPEKPGDLFQFEGRFSRLKGRPVTLHYLIPARTIAEKYKELVVDKMADIDSLGTETQGAEGIYSALAGKAYEEEVLGELRNFLSQLDEEDGLRKMEGGAG